MELRTGVEKECSVLVQWCSVCMFIATFMAGVTVAILSGNPAGGLVTFLVCCVVMTVGSRYCKISDTVLNPIGTVIWILGSFVFLGTETHGSSFLKNGVQLQSPFLAIPFYDNIKPMVRRVEVSVDHASTVHSFEPEKIEPRTYTIRANITAQSRSGELFVLNQALLHNEVRWRIRNMFVTGNDVGGYAEIAAQSLREGLEKDFPKLMFTGTLRIVYTGSAHSAL